MGRVIFLSVALAAVWLLLSGYFDKPLLLILGAASVTASVWFAARAGVLDVEGVPGAMMPGVFFYWIWLAGEIGKANWAVARQAIAVEPKLSPTLIRVPMVQRTNAGKATFANSITLTPGTVSIDLEGDEILVHGLTREIADIEGIRAMGERVARTERLGGSGA
jgi:multicomponent Na+:H+ antiporter subunit E